MLKFESRVNLPSRPEIEPSTPKRGTAPLILLVSLFEVLRWSTLSALCFLLVP